MSPTYYFINDTPVFDAVTFNPSTVSHEIWKGVGTRKAIEAAGFRVVDQAPVYYCPKEILKDGWSFRI
jgi:hypothetical protein